MFAFLLDLTGNEADTRDLLQEIFIRLAREDHLLETVRSERGFLIRMARNLSLDAHRRRGARERKHEAMAAHQAESIAALDPDEATFQASLEAALAELPTDQREVVHLKMWTGLTFEEIAGALDISPNTAASRYRYGLDKLRARLRPLYDEIK